MSWEVEYSDEFGKWWKGLTHKEQDKIDQIIIMLEQLGPMLPHPFSSGIRGSKHSHMRELRIQVKGNPYRVFYAFDPRRVAILLIGGSKVGNDRWYETFVPKADKILDDHLKALKKNRLI